MRARTLGGLGRSAEAAQALQALASRSPAADLLLARCLAQHPEGAAEADAILAKCEGARFATPESRLARARSISRGGGSRRRLPSCACVQTGDPERFEGRFVYARCALADGRFEEARAQLAVLVAQPDRFTAADVHLQREARAALASVLIRMQRHEEGIELLRPLVAECPAVVPWRVQLATVLSIRSRFAESIANWERAVELAPVDAELRLRLGDMYRSQGLFELAIAQYEKVIEIGRLSSEADVRLGDVYLRRDLAGDVEKARVHVERAVAHYPDSGDVLEMRGRLQEKLGLLAEACESHREAFARNPLRFESLYRLAMLLARSSDERERAESERILERYSRILPLLGDIVVAKQNVDFNPTHPAALTKLAALLNIAGEYEHALAWAERAEKLDPRSLQNAVQSAYIRANMNDLPGARKSFEKAIELARGVPEPAAVVATLKRYVESIDRGEALPSPLGELSHPAESEQGD